MNIIVCIKQVPGTTNVNIDPVTGTLIRDGVAAKMNPYDLEALELGLQLIERNGGKLSVVSMGPNSALEVLREAIYMGADAGVLISDRKFGGADVLATSYTLCSGIKAVKDYDLIITGKQTTDGDTAQVGSELAEHLQIPHIANVRKAEVIGNRLECVYQLDSKIYTADITMPCLICADGGINTPRLPSFKRKTEYGNAEDRIRIITFADVEDQDESHYGLKGSPTKVEKIFEPDRDVERKMISGTNLASKTYEVLKAHKFV
ncbi:MAG: electron transfer flavoprotein subunit beta/FixA family protein [Erysipelotrichaceae bacterium]|nr:electron transfer flavoprotein subunit beta/FixA family protein [Erysipelotrichaceae bacterium]